MTDITPVTPVPPTTPAGPEILDRLAQNGLVYKDLGALEKSVLEKEKYIQEQKVLLQDFQTRQAQAQLQIETLLQVAQEKAGYETPAMQSPASVPVSKELLKQMLSQIEHEKHLAMQETRKQAEDAFKQAFGADDEKLRVKYASQIQNMDVRSAIAYIQGASLYQPSTGDFISLPGDNPTTSGKWGKITAESDKLLRKTNPQAANSMEYIHAMSKAVLDKTF